MGPRARACDAFGGQLQGRHRASSYQKEGKNRETEPVIHVHHHGVRPPAQVRRDHILGVDVTKHPATTVVIKQDRPSLLGLLALGREAPDPDVWAGALRSRDGQVLGLSDGVLGPCAGDQDPGAAAGLDGLQVDLLLVDDVFVVEPGVNGV